MSLPSALANHTENLRNFYDNISERERVLLLIMIGLLLLMLICLPLYLVISAINETHDENERIHAVLRRIERERSQLVERHQTRLRMERRYRRPIPHLSTFIGKEGKKQGLDIREFDTQAETKTEDGYIQNRVEFKLADIGLRPLIKLMASIESSSYPVAFDKTHIEHFQSGDKYNVQLGVVTYHRKQN